MTKTDKYQFNLIDTSDPFSPDPLNDNMKKVETALEAETAELSMTIQKNQSAASSALSAHAADTVQHALVKLGSVEAPADTAASVELGDLSGYELLLVRMAQKDNTTTMPQLYLNNTYRMAFGYNSSGSYIYNSTFVFMPLGSILAGHYTIVSRTGALITDSCRFSNISWDTFRAVGLRCDGTAATITVYGLKA